MNYEIRPCAICNKPAIRTDFGFSCFDAGHNVLESGEVVRNYDGKPRIWSAHQQGIERLGQLFPEMKSGRMQELDDNLRRSVLSETMRAAEITRLKAKLKQMIDFFDDYTALSGHGQSKVDDEAGRLLASASEILEPKP